MIHFSDLGALHRGMRAELDEAIASCLERSAFVGGEDVSNFESEFAQWLRAKGGVVAGAVSCANGTDALELVLRALGIGPGHRVATVANTFFATVEAILSVGAEPLFVDVEPETLLMDPEKLAQSLDPSVRLVLPVHLYGQCCDMDRIMEIADRRGIPVVEDCAQAHGALWKGRPAGTFGVAGTFSFFPGKNLGALGDGGMVVCTEETLAKRVRMLANHGRSDKYLHLEPGRNSRLDALQAAILSRKLRHLDAWTEARNRAADRYLRGIGVGVAKLPEVRPGAYHVWHLFVVEVARRETVVEFLKAEGIQTGIHYPVPLHQQPACRDSSWAKTPLPVTESVSGRILSLPMHPHLEDAEIDIVCKALRDAAVA